MLVLGAGCGPDKETLDRQRAARADAATYAALYARTEADIRRTDQENERSKAIDRMFKRKSWADVRGRESLGFHATRWLRDGDASATLEGLIDQGTKVRAFTKDVSVALNEACDDTSAAEAFAVRLNAFGQEMARSAIAALPQLPGVEDARVVTRELGHSLNARTGVDDRGWLVAWLYEGALVGFVYHSRVPLTLAEVNARAPALVRVVQAALPKRTR